MRMMRESNSPGRKEIPWAKIPLARMFGFVWRNEHHLLYSVGKKFADLLLIQYKKEVYVIFWS